MPASAASGADLSMVRVHSDPQAARAARSIGAVAFTQGGDVYADPAAAGSGPAAHRIMTHEALHAAGQRRGISPPSVQRRSRVSEIGDLLGWWDSDSDAEKALALLEGMAAPDLNDTLGDMVTAGQVGRLSFRLKSRNLILRFLRVVAGASPARRDAVMAEVPFANLAPESQLVVYGQQFAAGRGAAVAGPGAGLTALVPASPAAPFSGVAPQAYRPPTRR
jgi:Domain of unknown function (DUF4157)